MPIVDLAIRLTTDKKQFESNSGSEESFIYVSGEDWQKDCNALDLTIGNSTFAEGKNFEIGEGYELKRGRGVVFETAQTIWVPQNVTGIVVGRGGLIYQGLFVSPGKINPGFRGALRIGVFNSGSKRITLKSGERICSCLFSTCESSVLLGGLIEERGIAIPTRPPIALRIKQQLLDRWTDILAMIISSTALIISIFKK
ncbi:MAG: dCTP deaminase domain-containing protein [Prosthecobacter sp.]